MGASVVNASAGGMGAFARAWMARTDTSTWFGGGHTPPTIMTQRLNSTLSCAATPVYQGRRGSQQRFIACVRLLAPNTTNTTIIATTSSISSFAVPRFFHDTSPRLTIPETRMRPRQAWEREKGMSEVCVWGARRQGNGEVPLGLPGRRGLQCPPAASHGIVDRSAPGLSSAASPGTSDSTGGRTWSGTVILGFTAPHPDSPNDHRADERAHGRDRYR